MGLMRKITSATTLGGVNYHSSKELRGKEAKQRAKLLKEERKALKRERKA